MNMKIKTVLFFGVFITVIITVSSLQMNDFKTCLANGNSESTCYNANGM